jgi:hypothetical protein
MFNPKRPRPKLFRSVNVVAKNGRRIIMTTADPTKAIVMGDYVTRFQGLDQRSMLHRSEPTSSSNRFKLAMRESG